VSSQWDLLWRLAAALALSSAIGPGSLTALAGELGGLDGVLAVSGEDLTGAPD
jgi:hypothetical protein